MRCPPKAEEGLKYRKRFHLIRLAMLGTFPSRGRLLSTFNLTSD